MKPKYRQLFRTTALMVITLSTAAHAQTRVNWTGATSTEWNDGTNWATNSVPSNTPAPGQHAVINNISSNFAVISEDLAATPVDIFVGVDAGSNGRLDHIAGNASTGSGNWMYVGNSGGIGVYNLSGTGSMNVAGNLFVGGGNNDGQVNNNGTATVDTAGQLTIGGNLQVGTRANSTGVFNLNSGEVTTNGWTEFGNFSGNGTLNMSGGSLTKNGADDNHFIIATNAGTGVANISGGTITITTGGFWIGNSANAHGTLHLSDASITKNGAGNLMIGSNGGTGVANVDSGSIHISNEIWVGQAANSSGTLNFSGGTISNNNWVAIGREGGTGTVEMTGGTWNKTGGGNFIVGASGSGTSGTMNMSGGTVNVGPQPAADRGIAWVGELNGVTGTLNLSGTALFETDAMVLGVAAGATGNINLNGGTLDTGRITGGNGTANATFNGGQIVARSDHNAFISNLDQAEIDSGGLRIDSREFTLTAPQSFTGTGGVVKTGSGTLTLSGGLAYSGLTDIQEGTLIVSDEQFTETSPSAYEVAGDAGFGVSLAYNMGVAATDVTFAANSEFNVELGVFGNPGDPVLTADTLGVNGPVTINIAAQAIFVGQFPLISYSSGSGTANFTLGELPPGVEANLVLTANTVELNVTRASNLFWVGALDDFTPSPEWNTISENWVNEGSFWEPSPFRTGDPVTFDDIWAADYNVILNTTVEPAEVAFRNTTETYTLSGTGKITGATTTLTKSEEGTVVISTANDYAGATRLEGGVLSVGSLPDGGVAGPIGASTAAPENLVIAGGTLEYTGGSATTDRGFTIAGPGGGISNGENLTIAGPVASTSGSFVKNGQGTLTFTNNGPNAFGLGNGGEILGFGIGNGTVLFEGGGAQTNAVSGSLLLGNAADQETSLVLSTSTLSAGGIFQSATQPGSKAFLSIGAGSQLNVDRFQLSMHATSETEVIVDAGSINKTGSSWISVGNTGKGTMTVRNGGSFASADGDFNISDVGTSQGFVHIESGGTVFSGGAAYIGKNGLTQPSELNITGAGSSFTGNNTIFVGFRGTGTVNLSGGSALNAGAWVVIGRHAANPGAENEADRPSGTGVVNVNAGGLLNQTGTQGIIVAEEGTGTLNVNTGGSVVIAGEGLYLTAQADTAGQGFVNLNGGTITARRVIERDDAQASPNNSSVFNFNGGTLIAGADAFPDFMSGLDQANVLAGGARIDSNGNDIAIAQNLSGNGGLTKLGSGTLTLSGITGYTGNTTVQEGILSVPASDLSDTGTVTINSEAVLDLPDFGIDVVAALVINGVPQDPGLYDSTNSGGAITGFGQLDVGGTPPTTGYDDWIAGFFPGETEPGIIAPGSDPDGDGQPNYLEFALGGNPDDGADNSRVYRIIADSNADTQDELLLTIAVRSGTPAFAGNPSPSATHDGYTYTIEGSTTLESFPLVVTPVAVIDPGTPAPAGYEYRTFRLEGSNGLPDKGFLRVKVQ